MAILVVCVLARYTFFALQNVCHHVLRTLCIRPFYKRLYSNREHVSRWIKLSIAKFVIGQKCNKNLFQKFVRKNLRDFMHTIKQKKLLSYQAKYSTLEYFFILHQSVLFEFVSHTNYHFPYYPKLSFIKALFRFFVNFTAIK